MRNIVITGMSGKGSVAPAQAKDPGKRQRIVLVALLVVLLVFGLKIWGKPVWSVNELYLIAIGAAVLSYAGLFFAFRFDVNARAFLTVLPQPAIFVFCFTSFIELFFFAKLGRIYEFLIFAVMLVVFLIVLIAVFLTANILNVATVKDLPLLRVAQTSSYVITLFCTYFLTFSVISSGIPFYEVLPILLILYFVVNSIHLSHFQIGWGYIRWYSIAIALVSMLGVASLLVFPLDTLSVALLPTAFAYAGVGIAMHHAGKTLSGRIYVEYVLVVLIMSVLVLLQATWGVMGGLIQ